MVWRISDWTFRNIWLSSLLSGLGIVLILFLLLLFNVFCLRIKYRLARARTQHYIRLLGCWISLIGSAWSLIWFSLLSGRGIVLILFLLLLFNVICLCHFYYLYRLVRPRVILTAWIHWLIYSSCRLSTLWRILYLLSISILLGWLLCWSILSIWSIILISVLIVIFVALNLIVVRITHLEFIIIIIIIYKLNKLRYFNISLIL